MLSHEKNKKGVVRAGPTLFVFLPSLFFGGLSGGAALLSIRGLSLMLWAEESVPFWGLGPGPREHFGV